MEIRRAEKAEIIAILSLYRKELSRLIEFNFPSGKLLKEFVERQEKLDEQLGYFIAVKNDEIIGAVLVDNPHLETYKHHDVLHLKHLAVAGNFRSQTVGTRLLEFAERQVKEYILVNKLNTCKVICELSEEVANATTFFEKCGYMNEGMINDYHVANVKTFLMGKTIRH